MRHTFRVQLAGVFAGLFCALIALAGVTAFLILNAGATRAAREHVNLAASSVESVLRMRTAQLQEGAARAGADPALLQANAQHDYAAMGAALSALSARLQADAAFVITAEGLLIDTRGVGMSSVPPGLQATLAHAPIASGMMDLGGTLHHGVSANLPDGDGYILIADRADQSLFERYAALMPRGLDATILRRTSDGMWGAPDMALRGDINRFVIQHTGEGPFALRASGVDEVALAAPLASMDGAASTLLLRYQRASAMGGQQALLLSIFLIGGLGLAAMLATAWRMARRVTQPLAQLATAAINLRDGVYAPVDVRAKNEFADTAQSFNAMIETIRAREHRITQLAYHDVETRLPNRLALERKLATNADTKRLFLAAIGVDRFAEVRGAIGYAHAGTLIRRLGARLARLAPNGPMARLSSDVLGIAFLADGEEDARKRANALVDHLDQPLELEGQVVDVNVSIGIAQPRGKEETPAAMIDRASIALDQARAARSKAAFFDEGAYGDPARNLSLMGEMRKALGDGHIFLAHQPKYDFRSGRIGSVECLVRWRHPTRGMISPDLFVPMAEETGHIRALTEWVLRRAIAEQIALAEAGWPLAFSLNVSGRLLGDADFAASALEVARTAKHPLCFEITETAVIDNPTQALKNIECFANNNIRISIDDYGSGLSSLAYLKQMPAHELKIDKMFIESITASERDALLVRSTIELGRGLGLQVTAEGVETPAAFALLAHMGCDMAQGYFIGRPSPAGELLALLNDRPRMRFYQQTAAAGVSPAQADDVGPSTRREA